MVVLLVQPLNMVYASVKLLWRGHTSTLLILFQFEFVPLGTENSLWSFKVWAAFNYSACPKTWTQVSFQRKLASSSSPLILYNFYKNSATAGVENNKIPGPKSQQRTGFLVFLCVGTNKKNCVRSFGNHVSPVWNEQILRKKLPFWTPALNRLLYLQCFGPVACRIPLQAICRLYFLTRGIWKTPDMCRLLIQKLRPDDKTV